MPTNLQTSIRYRNITGRTIRFADVRFATPHDSDASDHSRIDIPPGTAPLAETHHDLAPGADSVLLDRLVSEGKLVRESVTIDLDTLEILSVVPA